MLCRGRQSFKYPGPWAYRALSVITLNWAQKTIGSHTCDGFREHPSAYKLWCSRQVVISKLSSREAPLRAHSSNWVQDVARAWVIMARPFLLRKGCGWPTSQNCKIYLPFSTGLLGKQREDDISRHLNLGCWMQECIPYWFPKQIRWSVCTINSHHFFLTLQKWQLLFMVNELAQAGTAILQWWEKMVAFNWGKQAIQPDCSGPRICCRQSCLYIYVWAASLSLEVASWVQLFPLSHLPTHQSPCLPS